MTLASRDVLVAMEHGGQIGIMPTVRIVADGGVCLEDSLKLPAWAFG